MILLAVVILAALIFEFINGFHDTANSVAAVVGTKVLTPSRAIALAAVMNLLGALAGTAVATTVGKGLVDAKMITSTTLICALAGATLWNLLTWWLTLPSSSSHALFGGLVGAAVASAGTWDVVIWSAPVEGRTMFAASGLLPKVIIPMFSSPLFGFAVGVMLMSGLFAALISVRASRANAVFRKLQVCSAAFLGFSHGSNDAQKTMGIVALALFTATQSGELAGVPAAFKWLLTPEFHIPLWVKILCAIVMAAGTAAGGRRIIRTVGRRMARLQPGTGFSADMTSALVLMTTARLGMPVSTTHVVSAAIMGVGAARNSSAIRWDVVESILWTWVLTLPASGLVAYALFKGLHALGLAAPVLQGT